MYLMSRYVSGSFLLPKRPQKDVMNYMAHLLKLEELKQIFNDFLR